MSVTGGWVVGENTVDWIAPANGMIDRNQFMQPHQLVAETACSPTELPLPLVETAAESGMRARRPLSYCQPS
jgi:hypothetical protein